MQLSKEDSNADIVQKSIGVLGRWHIWICGLIFLVKFPVAWHQLSIVFLAPPVTFSCADNHTDRCATECTNRVYDRSVFSETIITQWDLVCERAQLANLAQTVTMLGILFGNLIFGILADKYGRKNPLALAVFLQLIGGTVAAFTQWFWIFLVIRFLCAVATGGTMVISFVLIMELVGIKWRTAIGILYQIPFNLGHLTLAIIGYYIRDWHYIQVAISVPSALLISYYWLLPESPRWLLTVGETEQAIETLEKSAHHNRLSTSAIRENVNTYIGKQATTQQETGRICDLVRTPNMRYKTISIGFNWVVCGLCFFGVAQYIGQLGGNIFLNVGLSALVQIPGTIFTVWVTKILGRRNTLMASNALTGCSCLLIALVPTSPSWPRALLGCAGLFGLSVSFPTVYIYSGELYPTVIRNVGVGTSSMCARIGSMLAPFVTGLVDVEPWLPSLIFGLMPLIGALLCYNLPETRDSKLPETIRDAELFGSRSLEKTEKNGISNPAVDIDEQ